MLECGRLEPRGVGEFHVAVWRLRRARHGEAVSPVAWEAFRWNFRLPVAGVCWCVPECEDRSSSSSVNWLLLTRELHISCPLGSANCVPVVSVGSEEGTGSREGGSVG
jgi:hypothetical protein